MFFSDSDYKIPNGQPLYTISTPNEPPKFTIEEVLKAYNALGFPDVNQSTIDKIAHYLLDEEDEYSEYIRLKEKFEGVKSAEPEPVQTPTREPTGYRYTYGLNQHSDAT